MDQSPAAAKGITCLNDYAHLGRLLWEGKWDKYMGSKGSTHKGTFINDVAFMRVQSSPEAFHGLWGLYKLKWKALGARALVDHCVSRRNVS